MASEGFFERVYEVVEQIPEGMVATYGQVALLAGRVYQPAHAQEVPELTSQQVSALEARAFAAAGAPEGLTAPESVAVQIRSGETFEQAVRRTGIGPEEAHAVAATVSNGGMRSASHSARARATR